MKPSSPTSINRPRSSLAVAGLLASAGLYLTSLALPALLFENHEPVTGATVLGAGWMGPFAGWQIAWYANLFYGAIVVFTLLKRYGVSLWFGPPCAAIALTSPQAHTWYFNESTGTPIQGLGSAYPVWLAALILPILANAAALILWRRQAAQSPPSAAPQSTGES
jgi:hypothetical protein